MERYRKTCTRYSELCKDIETSDLRSRSIEMHAVSSKIINHDVEPNTVLYQSIYAVTILN